MRNTAGREREEMMMDRATRDQSAAGVGLLNPDRTVADVMRTDFRSCSGSTPIEEAATALRLSGGPVLTVTRADIPVGVVSERTLAWAVAEHRGDLSRLTAEDVMRSDPPTVEMTAPVREALERLEDSPGFVLAVNSEGMLKGLVTLAELGPQLTPGCLNRLVMKLQPIPAVSPAEEARAEDPTAKVKSDKSQAQPHAWDSPTREHPAPIPLVSPADMANPVLTAKDVMAASPRTCSPESSVLEAAAVFRNAECGAVPVVEGGRPVGVLTDRDAILALPEREFDLARTPVGEIMSRELVTVESETPIDKVLDRLGDEGVRRVLVVDSKGMLVGVVSWTDLVPHLSERGLGHAVSRIVGPR